MACFRWSAALGVPPGDCCHPLAWWTDLLKWFLKQIYSLSEGWGWCWTSHLLKGEFQMEIVPGGLFWDPAVSAGSHPWWQQGLWEFPGTLGCVWGSVGHCWSCSEPWQHRLCQGFHRPELTFPVFVAALLHFDIATNVLKAWVAKREEVLPGWLGKISLGKKVPDSSCLWIPGQGGERTGRIVTPAIKYTLSTSARVWSEFFGGADRVNFTFICCFLGFLFCQFGCTRGWTIPALGKKNLFCWLACEQAECLSSRKKFPTNVELLSAEETAGNSLCSVAGLGSACWRNRSRIQGNHLFF